MKVGHQRIDDMKGLARIQKNIGITCERLDLPITCCRLQRAHAGSANRDNTTATGLALLDRRDYLGTDLKPFLMHHVIFNALNPNRLKGTRANMQCHFCSRYALVRYGLQQCLIKM